MVFKIEIHNLLLLFFTSYLFTFCSCNMAEFQSKIELILIGKGNQYFLNETFYLNPSLVIINGIQNDSCKKNCTFDKDLNNVTIKFSELINSCENMFYGLNNLIEIDLSNLDTSKVTNMASMFEQCSNLEKINFGNINTSLVKDMYALFHNCTKLESIDVSNFDTSFVTSLNSTFRYCESLTSIDVSNFNTQNVVNMFDIFAYCYSLISADLSNFDTSKVTNMQGLFYLCYKLKHVNLRNFNTSLVINLSFVFVQCRSLIYINLYSLKIRNNTNMNKEGIFDSTPSNLKICINDQETQNILSSSGKVFNCSDIYFNNNIKIDLKQNICVANCKENENKYELNNYCYEKCPNTSYLIKNNDYLCLNKNSDNNYFFDANDKIFKECYITCKICNEEGNEINNNCIECKDGFMFLNDSISDKNCYKICQYLYYFNEFNQYICTEERTCPKNYSKLIKEKNKCINDCLKDNIYKYEHNNICYSYEFNETETFLFVNNTYEEQLQNIITYELILTKLNIDKTIYNNEFQIQKEFKISTVQNIIMTEVNLTKLNDNDIIINNNNNNEKIIYTITSTSNQENHNKKKNNKTSIHLGDCENKLKEHYNISKNDNLFILKIDAYLDGMKMPKIEYEVYYPLFNQNLSKLNLSICQNTKINISIPVDISINEIDKYNASSGLYNDLCYTLTENGTDKILKDRRNDFAKNNMTVCEENCKFIYYDNEIKKATCSCSVKEEISLISDIKINSKMIISNFMDTNNFANFELIKCIHLLFKRKNIFKNTANYLIIVILIISIISIFIVTCHDYINIKNTINNLTNTKQDEKDIKITQSNQRKRNKYIITNINNINADDNNNNNNFGSGIKFMNSILNNNNENPKGMININNENIKKIKKKKKKRASGTNNLIRKKRNKFIYVINPINNISDKKTENEDEINSYIDYELNSLEFKEALRIDKRAYTQYYLSLLRTKHLLLFSFYNNKDYNSKVIKIYIFFFNIVTIYTLNAMFYSETIMHRIYVESGKFNFITQIPEMIYSSLLTSVLNTIMKSLGLFQDNIIKIKKCDKKKIEQKKLNEIKIIKCKILFFFIINYIFLFFYWVYLGCFCAIYQNTQVHLLKEVLSSFATSLITPFLFNIIPGIFRIPSLKKEKSSLYKFSKFLQII